MIVRPNFTGASIQSGEVRVTGESGIAPDGTRVEFDQDVVDIRVVLIQGERTDHRPVDSLDANWTATFSVADEVGSGPDYTAGPAVAVGVERRRENDTVISWTQTLPIQ
jgi:hypothetical protein